MNTSFSPFYNSDGFTSQMVNPTQFLSKDRQLNVKIHALTKINQFALYKNKLLTNNKNFKFLNGNNGLMLSKEEKVEKQLKILNLYKIISKF